VVFWAVHRIWPPGNALTFSRLLVGLGIVQLLTVVTMDLPKFLGSGNNPDVISGTFGENAYQLVFFLLVLVALLSGINSFERERLIVKVIPVFLVAIFAIIVLAQYRALLVTTALTVIGLGAVLSIGRPRAFILTLVTVGALVMALSYVSQAFPRLRLGQTISDFGNNPTLYLTERVKIMDDIWRLYGDNPRYVLTGSGPGTYSSRAWEVFASDSQLQTSSAGVLASKLLGGRPYSTDVSEKYVVPRLSKVVSGSHAITNPRATWPSLFAEVGVPGAMMIMVLYALLLVAVLRRVLVCLRTRRSGDPVPALLLAGGTAIFVLLQMGSLQNWLEVARVTFLAAAIVAVAIKEFDAAHPAEA
jgi:hypothetical protein